MVANICYGHKIMPGIINLMHFSVMFVMGSSTQPKTTAAKNVHTMLLPQN